MAAAVVIVLAAGGISRLRLDTTAGSFLPSGDRSLQTWISEQRSFGSDPIVVLLTSNGYYQFLAGAPLQQEIALEGRLAKLTNVAVVYGPGTTLNQIAISIQNLLVDIAGKRSALIAQAQAAAKAAGKPPAEQQAAGQQAVSAFDQRYLALIGEGLRLGLPTLANPIFGRSVFLQPDGHGRPAFRWLVPDATHIAILVRPAANLSQTQTTALVDAVRADVIGAHLPVKSALVTGSPVVASAMGQEVARELPVLAAIAIGLVLLSFLVLRRRLRWWERLLPLGLGLGATLLTMSAFGWLGRPLSLGLLAFLPIILGVGTDYPIYALDGSPVRLVAVTVAASAASLAVLAVSPLPYVRDLGAALVVGLVLSAILGLVAARLLRSTNCASAGTDHRPRRYRIVEPHRRRVAWLAAAAAALAAGAAGWASLATIGIESNPEQLASGLPALRQAVKAQSVLGASGELDVYVRGRDVLTPQYLSWYTRAQDTLLLAHGDQLDPVVSPASLFGWLGPDPTESQIGAALQVLPWYLTTAAVRDDKTQAVMSFGVKLGRLDSEERLIDSVRSELPPPPPGSSVGVTGLPAVAAHGYRLLAGDRLWSNLGGLVTFGVVLTLLARRRRDALVAVVSAALASGWVLLILRLSGTAFSPLTVSLGTLTSAVGGEFAVIAIGRRRAGAPRPWSAPLAGAATSAAGFLALAASRLEVLRQFGLVLAASVALALASAWVVVSASDLLGSGRYSQAGIAPAGGPLEGKPKVLAKR